MLFRAEAALRFSRKRCQFVLDINEPQEKPPEKYGFRHKTKQQARKAIEIKQKNKTKTTTA